MVSVCPALIFIFFLGFIRLITVVVFTFHSQNVPVIIHNMVHNSSKYLHIKSKQRLLKIFTISQSFEEDLVVGKDRTDPRKKKAVALVH